MSDRKIVIEMKISPSELRVIAGNLEKCKSVNWNWYHTQIRFTRDDDKFNQESTDE